MVGQRVRKGGAVLAALAIVAAGAVTGVGSAGAAGMGSSGAACATCTQDSFRDYQYRGDILVDYRGPGSVVVGQQVAFTAEFVARHFGPGPMPDVKVATVTHRAPEGFEFTGAEVTAYDWTPGKYPMTPLDASVTVDPVTGYLTLTAPEGGWAIPGIADATEPGTTRTGSVIVKLRYSATKSVSDGVSNLTFTGTDVPASDGWVTTGTTRVDAGPQGLGGFGSSGS
ncbi:hypothetical protein [Rhodococcus sp. NPDC059234]|uniref:hypothetical protein n=1 Tax=Rhodococcus sp. NPDC059234 TaxID=3346781 RepID=UPI00366CA5E8